MKKFKRIMALVIALAMVLSMGAMTAFATAAGAENSAPTSTGNVTGKITIENPQIPDGAAQTYKIYKLFDVTYEDGSASATATTDLYAYSITNNPAIGSALDWFDAITGAGMTTSDEGKTWVGNSGTGYAGLTFTRTAGDANTYAVTVDKTVFSAPAFAKALNAIGTKPEPVASANSPESGTLVFEGLDLGYWFVTTTTGSLCNLTTIHPDEIIYDKNEVPNVDKSIVEGDDEVKNNNAAIGDVIEFKMDTKVPSMVGFDNYHFIVKDTFSKGLSLVDVADAQSKTESQYYAAGNTDKYYGKNTITVKMDAGDPAATHPEKTLKRVYLGNNGEYYMDSKCTQPITQHTEYDANGKRNRRELTQDAENAGFELDDDLNLKYAYYVKVIEANADVSNTLQNRDDATSSTRPDTYSKGETRMEIVFVDMIQYLDQTNGVNNANDHTVTEEGTLGSADTTLGYTGKGIHITYFAEVDEDAIVNDENGNPNTAKITYSNDPTNTGDGTNTPDEPGPNTPTGDSPESKTNSFVTGIKLTKIDGGDTTKKLAGAQFELKNTTAADNLLNMVIQNGVRYEKKPYTLKKVNSNEDGVSQDATSAIVYAKEELADEADYYLLNDGTYTAKTPADAGNNDLYASTTDKYAKVKYTWVVNTAYNDDGTALTTANKHISTSGTDGVISFAGLKAGTYTLTELIAPDGYNKMTEDITIEIKAKYVDTNNNDAEINADDDEKFAGKCVWTAILNGGGFTDKEITLSDNDDTAHSADVLKLLAFEVENNQGTILPSTGGIGTTIFYVLGAILVIGAGVVLITRRRMEA